MIQGELFGNLENTIKSGDTITCKFCGVKKNVDSFSFASGGNYRHRTCKSCTNQQQKIRDKLRLENPPPPKEYKCPICVKKEVELEHLNNPNQVVWALDHDWETGTFRGWICHKCNRALGMFHDDVSSLQRAIEYLERK